MRSMPDTENPRSHIQPLPLPIPSHQELQITARNAKFHTCEVPTRKEVAMRRIMNVEIKWANAVIARSFTSRINRLGRCFWIILSALGQEQTEQNNQAYLGEKPYPLGRHIHLWLIQGSTPPPHGVISCCLLLVHVISCTFYVASSTWMSSRPFFLRHLVYLSRRSISFSLLTMFFFLSCINNQQWKADAFLAVALCKLTVTNFEF